MNKLKQILVALILVAYGVSFSELSAEYIRAAFDVGSGTTKMTVAEVEETTGQPVQILFSEQTEVLLAHDFKQRNDGYLSDEILQKAESALTRYRNIARDLGAEDFAGIATAVFRESQNGPDFIKKVREIIGINLHLVSQEEEGRIGFLTAVAGSGKSANEVIAWDSGGASFQITTEDDGVLKVYEGPWGGSKVQAAMIEEVQGNDFSIIQTANPATIENVHVLNNIIQENLPEVSIDLQLKFRNPNVNIVCIGGPTSICNIAAMAIGADAYSKEQVWCAIEELVGSSDEELSRFPQREMVIPNLTLLFAVMDHFTIEKVCYTPTNGSTLGIFISPEFWETSKVVIN